MLAMCLEFKGFAWLTKYADNATSVRMCSSICLQDASALMVATWQIRLASIAL